MGKISGEEGWISLGPWGGKGGVYATYKPDGPVIQITIRYGDVIDSILFESKSPDGVVMGSSAKIGGTGGNSSTQFSIDSSMEQFSSLSLRYKDYQGHAVVTSLCFVTNLKKYGPVGREVGHPVCIPIEGGFLTGFHGRGGRFLDAIGVFVAPKTKVDFEKEEELKTKIEELMTENKELKEREGVVQLKMEAQNKEFKEKMEEMEAQNKELKEKMEEMEAQNKVFKERIKVMEKKENVRGEEGLISLGIQGGKEGAYWAYKVRGPTMQISVCYGQVIDSISFKSKSCWRVGRSVKIGGSGGHTTVKFCIDNSDEQLSSISLTYEDFRGEGTILSLCFNTNLRKYGPFGSRTGTYSVSIPIEGGVFAGFHGRVGTYLTAIGVLVAPAQSE